jgi:hypothetical protein
MYYFRLRVVLFSNGFEVFSVLPNRILIMFVEMNMYVLYLMHMYSPTKDANECNSMLIQCRWVTLGSKQKV